MSEHIREIAQRLRAMREITEVSAEELSKHLSISLEQYIDIEGGDVDIPVSVLCECAVFYGIDVTELLTGTKAKLHQFSLCRRDKNTGTERTDGYFYKPLAQGFSGRKVEPLLVTIPAHTENGPLHLNTHNGQEFHFCTQGSFKFHIDGHEVIVNEGDALYFDSKFPHAMSAIGGDAKIVVLVIN